MLSAIDENFNLIVACEFDNHQLEKMRKSKKFFCTCCEDELRIMNCTKKLSHFAHNSKSDCPNRTGEGDTKKKRRAISNKIDCIEFSIDSLCTMEKQNWLSIAPCEA